MRDQVVEKLTALIKGLWPQATVKLFGSVAANLFLPTSVRLQTHSAFRFRVQLLSYLGGNSSLINAAALVPRR